MKTSKSSKHLFILDLLSLRKNAIKSDQYDRYMYSQIRKSWGLDKLEEKCSSKLVTLSPIVQDCFNALYKMVPELCEEIEMRSSYLLNRKLMKQVLECKEYQELRNYTKLRKEETAIGTASIIEYILQNLDDLLPYELLTKLQEQEKKEDELIQDVEKNLSQYSRNKLEKLEKEIEKTGKDLENNLEEVDEIIRSIAYRGVNKANEESDELAELMSMIPGGFSWSTIPGRETHLDFKAKIEMAKKLRENKNLLELSKIVGKFRRLAINKQKTKIASLPTEIFNIVTGDDFSRMIPAELANLSQESLRYDFYRRYTERQLLQYDMKGREKKGKGSMVVCVDSSGSMAGAKEIKSKAIALGLLEIAIFQRRNFVVMFFGSRSDTLKIIEISNNKKGNYLSLIYELVTYFLGGGTDFETPLNASIQILQKDEYKDGDIVFITDGICNVSDNFLKKYQNIKKERKFSTFSVLIDALDINNRDMQKQVVEKFSDRVLFSENFIDSDKGNFNDDFKIADQLYSFV